ncbi:MAG: oxidoreductase, partial [Rhodobacterales bacterium CG18_big_fil_WC_8_21_14_2_50_71_9]
WYTFSDPAFGGATKGGTIDFLLSHPNPISRASRNRWDGDALVWGTRLQKRLLSAFTGSQALRYEIFCDWLPTDDCFVTLDSEVTDRWGSAVAKVRIGYHPHDLKVGNYINTHALKVLERMGATDISSDISGSPPPNLVAGGCRFGDDPRTAVLDRDCRVHGVDNLYVSDGSFMPTGGSVPYTWTIYANAFRVAEAIKAAL